MRRILHSEKGTSLVEVVVALLILVSFVLPITKYRYYILSGGPSGKELAQVVAIAKLEELGDLSYRTLSWPYSGEDDYWAIGHLFHRIWEVTPTNAEMGSESLLLRRATVTVTCSDCRGTSPEVKVVGLLEKI